MYHIVSIPYKYKYIYINILYCLRKSNSDNPFFFFGLGSRPRPSIPAESFIGFVSAFKEYQFDGILQRDMWKPSQIIKSVWYKGKETMKSETPSAFNDLHSENGHIEIPSGCDRITTNRKWSNNFKYLSIHHACPQQHYAQSLVRADGALDDQTTGARSVHS